MAEFVYFYANADPALERREGREWRGLPDETGWWDPGSTGPKRAAELKARPIGVTGLAGFGRIGEFSLAAGRPGVERRERFTIAANPTNEPRLRKGDELVAPIRPWPIQLLRL